MEMTDIGQYLGCARAMRLLIVGASRTDSAGEGCGGWGECGGAPLAEPRAPVDRSTPAPAAPAPGVAQRAYASSSSGRIFSVIVVNYV